MAALWQGAGRRQHTPGLPPPERSPDRDGWPPPIAPKGGAPTQAEAFP